MSHATPDDGFREIQLSGKQLVFLFMAATVVSVVIFLCGVLVGRGVRAERAANDASMTNEAASDFAPARPTVVASVPSPASDPTTAAPPVPVEDLSYFKRLEQPNQAVEELKPASAKGAAKEPKASSPKPENAAAKAAATKAAIPAPAPAARESTPPKEKEPAPKESAPAADVTAASTPPSTGGYAVQIAALNVRSEADAVAKRLGAKGYAAYVVTSPGTPTFFRVRVGTFKTRHEADTMAARLQKEEQLKVTPFVTR